MGEPIGPQPEDRPARSRSGARATRGILGPLQEFLETSVASGLVLLIAVAAALAWANSPWEASYASFFSTTLSIGVGELRVTGDLVFWINEGLMALFFLVAGLEIKRELTTGELRRARAALLPVIAAAAGMAVPALLYVAIVRGGPGADGWAIPMATDVAFALGVLALAAARAPSGLRPLLLALAIVDDIGSVIVLAVFYAGDVSAPWLAVTIAVVFLFPALTWLRVRATLVYVVLGMALWYAMYRAGIHPALAGVVVGALTPSEPFVRPRRVGTVGDPAAVDDPPPTSQLTRVEHALLPWSSFVVLPLFALANVGVDLSPSSLAAAAGSVVTWAIVVARVGGKLVGIWSGASLAARAGIVDLPRGVGPTHLAGMGLAAGTGFTVSLFVAETAFGSDDALLANAKIALLAASVLSACLAIPILRRAGRGRDAPPASAAAEST
jgi:NhaA family Na+:H+ antiporter